MGKRLHSLVTLDGREQGSGGICNDSGNVFGSYLHGIFDNSEFGLGFINNLRRQKGLDLLKGPIMNYREYKEQQYDNLALIIRQNVDLAKIYRIIDDWGV